MQLRGLQRGLPALVELRGRGAVREQQRDQRRVAVRRRRVQRRLSPRAARRRPWLGLGSGSGLGLGLRLWLG